MYVVLYDAALVITRGIINDEATHAPGWTEVTEAEWTLAEPGATRISETVYTPPGAFAQRVITAQEYQSRFTAQETSDITAAAATDIYMAAYQVQVQAMVYSLAGKIDLDSQLIIDSLDYAAGQTVDGHTLPGAPPLTPYARVAEIRV